MPPELEAKLIAPDDLRLADLSGLVDGATAVRFRHVTSRPLTTRRRTCGLRGAGLRSATAPARGPPWTVKFPGSGSGAALRRRKSCSTVHPTRFRLRPWLWSAPAPGPALLELAACLRTERTPIEIRGRDGQRLADVTAGRVTGHDGHRDQLGHFREVESKSRPDAWPALISCAPRSAAWRRRAAALNSRAQADPATRPASVRTPRGRDPATGPDATVSAVIRHATSRSLTQIMRHDPGIRLGEDSEDVHQFRVATRAAPL